MVQCCTMLQTRSGKRTAKSAVKIAVDMVKEKLISKKEAVLRIDPNSLDTLLHPTLDEKSSINVIANGLPASPGAASGKVVFTSEEAERLTGMMQDTILVRVETSPEDIQGMHAAKGILTARGGMTSHAAVVARGMGRPCVSGSSEIDINYENKSFKTSSMEIKEGEVITIDGSTGRIISGSVATVKPEISGDFSKLMSWADSFRKLNIRTNSETPKDTKTAKDFGAEGIGLCRTEHMFFDEERILSVREMILSKTKEDRAKALDKLLPHQKKDFVEIFKIMGGLPVTVRLLDPPLHEFLPRTEKEISEVANVVSLSVKEVVIVLFEGLQKQIVLKSEEVKGPNVNAPEVALEGFMRSNSISKEDLFKKKIDKGEFYFFNIKSKKLNTHNFLEKLVPLVLQKIQWKKSMKWGEFDLNWGRPLKSILAVFDKKKLTFDFHHLTSSNSTFIDKEYEEKKKIFIDFKEYNNFFKNLNIVIDHEQRKTLIEKKLNEISNKKNIKIESNPKLLNEIVDLTDQPNVILCEFDRKFLNIPKEILTITMQHHQKYFPTFDKKGNITNEFLVVTNKKDTNIFLKTLIHI